MSKITQLPQITPKTGGGDSGAVADCLIIEKVSNGYILRAIIGGGEEDGIQAECRVYTDRSELLRDVAGRL